MLLICDIKRNSKIDGMGPFNSLCGDTALVITLFLNLFPPQCTYVLNYVIIGLQCILFVLISTSEDVGSLLQNM